MMKEKFLVILPISIAGTLIMKGFSAGLKECGVSVVEKDIREIEIDDLSKSSVTSILGYDYGYLHNESLAQYILKNLTKYKLINYFADAPHSAFANARGNNIYEQLCEINPFVFMWDKTYINEFKKCKYLPLAVNYNLYKCNFNTPLYPISFVGRPLGTKRQKLLATVSKIYGNKLKIFSYEKHFQTAVSQMQDTGLLNVREAAIFNNSYCGFVKTEKELAEIYNRSLINLNVTIQGENNLNYRVFEVLASCGFLLTDFQKDVQELFDISKELEVYKDETDLVDKIDFYLKNNQIAEKIAINGFAKVIEKHTFTNRVKTILSTIGSI